VKLKCPACGATGTDVAPYEHERPEGAPPLPESTKRDMDAYAFEVYGNLGGRPVRKCLNCGAGIRVTFLPPRFRKLSDEEWAEFKVRFETWREQDRARVEAQVRNLNQEDQ
jgi:hypothetical protein